MRRAEDRQLRIVHLVKYPRAAVEDIASALRVPMDGKRAAAMIA
jgi:hypothetical protein